MSGHSGNGCFLRPVRDFDEAVAVVFRPYTVPVKICSDVFINEFVYDYFCKMEIVIIVPFCLPHAVIRESVVKFSEVSFTQVCAVKVVSNNIEGFGSSFNQRIKISMHNFIVACHCFSTDN